MAAKTKGGLGKGLDALWVDNLTEQEYKGSVSVKIHEIEPNSAQPRKTFDEEGLRELADSIAEHGIIQPIIVRVRPDGGYQIIAGERRWRAARMAGLTEIPVLVRDINEREMMELALVENLQREDLNPIEEAEGLKALIENYGLTQEEAAKKVGKSRPAVANSMRLLALPGIVLEQVKSGKLSAGHAKALLSLNDEEKVLLIANDIIEKGYSVRDTERIVKLQQKEKKERKKNAGSRDRYFDEAELALSQEIGRKCKIHGGANEKGTLEIPFFSKEDLGSILELFTKN